MPTVCMPWHQAEADAEVRGGHLATITSQAEFDGFVVGATITDPGCGYTNAPVVLIQGGNGSGATATAVITDGQVTRIIISDAGFGYDTPPRIVIASPPFVPKLNITVSRIKVSQNVVLGRRYCWNPQTT